MNIVCYLCATLFDKMFFLCEERFEISDNLQNYDIKKIKRTLHLNTELFRIFFPINYIWEQSSIWMIGEAITKDLHVDI